MRQGLGAAVALHRLVVDLVEEGLEAADSLAAAALGHSSRPFLGQTMRVVGAPPQPQLQPI